MMATVRNYVQCSSALEIAQKNLSSAVAMESTPSALRTTAVAFTYAAQTRSAPYSRFHLYNTDRSFTWNLWLPNTMWTSRKDIFSCEIWWRKLVMGM